MKKQAVVSFFPIVSYPTKPRPPPHQHQGFLPIQKNQGFFIVTKKKKITKNGVLVIIDPMHSPRLFVGMGRQGDYVFGYELDWQKKLDEHCSQGRIGYLLGGPGEGGIWLCGARVLMGDKGKGDGILGGVGVKYIRWAGEGGGRGY